MDQAVAKYNCADFVGNDPISIPKQYKLKQDVEITAFWTAMLSWGQRKTIINKANELFGLMDNEPYHFILEHKEIDRKRFENFKHRTFQYTDTLYFLEFLQYFYRKHESLEEAFIPEDKKEINIELSLIHFHNYFFSLDYAPQRTRKHISTPAKNSACKRLNMFLRWMVRKDNSGVDFGLWKKIKAKDLMIPLDVHVFKIAKQLNLLESKQSNWKAVLKLTKALRKFDNNDPVKYDYALFGLGVKNPL